MFSQTKLNLGGKDISAFYKQIRDVIGAAEAKKRVVKRANKYKLVRSKFKQGMRLLTIRRMEFLNSFQTEAKWVGGLET